VPELKTNLFPPFSIIAQKAASLAGYEVVICHSNESFSNEMEVLKRLFAYQVDGIILSFSSGFRKAVCGANTGQVRKQY
jgi:LacI family transcriptional regulator/LacI family repressor for deo operon, udp, cdd, tsx, nupC, and nupG